MVKIWCYQTKVKKFLRSRQPLSPGAEMTKQDPLSIAIPVGNPTTTPSPPKPKVH